MQIRRKITAVTDIYACWRAAQKAKGAFVSESALHSFDGDKPNSVDPALCFQSAERMIIHLAAIARSARQPFGGHRPPLQRRGATIPED
jgi:hypothetical protein